MECMSFAIGGRDGTLRVTYTPGLGSPSVKKDVIHWASISLLVKNKGGTKVPFFLKMQGSEK